MSAVLSFFWSRLDWLLILAALLLAGGGTVLGCWLGWWARGRQRETAVGVVPMTPADGAAPADAAPAPTAPVGRAGAVGVIPDDFPGGGFTWFGDRDRREAEQAAEVTALVGGGPR